MATVTFPKLPSAIEAELLAQAPLIACDFIEFMRPLAVRLFAKLGPTLRVDSAWSADAQYVQQVRPLCHMDQGYRLQQPKDSSKAPEQRWVTIYALSEAKLAAAAERYGREWAQAWVAKMEGKLAGVEKCELKPSSELTHGRIVIVGERAGRRVQIAQQRILNVSPKGKVFHQWPSKIYVDGKLHSEAAYKKLFAAKAVA